MKQKKMAYYGKKVLIFFFSVLILSITVFYVARLAPGDPLVSYYGERSEKMSPEEREWAMEKLGLNEPISVQYVKWVKNALHGDFGTSIRYRSAVWDLMKARIPYSLKLCGISLVLELVIALPLGLLCAIKKDGFFDRFTVNFSLFLTAIPSFWLGALMILILAVQLKLVPISGYEHWQNYIMPVLTMVLGGVGGTLRITKTEVLDVINEKYVTTAYAKGLPKRTVMIKHVLRNSLILVTTLVFMSIPWLISGAVITERIFGFPGMGNLLLNSIIVQDITVVQAVLLLIAILTVICNLISDILMGILDPRIRLSLAGGDN